MRYKLILAMILLVSITAFSDEGGTSYILDSGDLLTVIVRGVEELSGLEILVRDDGFISFPYAGEVFVRGKTIDELKSILDLRLLNYLKSPDVIIVLTQPRKIEIGIIGAVNGPGIYSIPNNSSLLTALSYCGGPNLTEAKLVGLKIYKKDGRLIKVNLRRLLNDPRGLDKYPIEQGDVIFIPKKFFSWELTTLIQILSVVTITIGLQEALRK